MSRELVIVESPAKAKTVGAILGSKYTVKASVGHVRDLPKSQLGVDVEHDFKPKYIVPKEKRQVVKDLKESLKGITAVYLATDPDREGEAISWHLLQAASLERLPIQRVVFHEITPQAIQEAFAHPREIDMRLVNAQQARRILDRLVGYSISPLLWRKVKGRLSAGRVQSVALKMVVDREREIEHFLPREYWTIEAELSQAVKKGRRTKSDRFKAGLVGAIDAAGKAQRVEIANQAEAAALTTDLERATVAVAEVRKGKVSRQPEPPFTTSTLQQESFRKLHFSAQRTMLVAQQLYEGLSMGDSDPVGIITYMRTDSVRIADSAIEDIRGYVKERWGADAVPRAPRVFKTRSKGAQEAHEAIRPTSVRRLPDEIKPFLTQDQFRLYDLIWKRGVASQMAAAGYDTQSVDVTADATEAGGKQYRLRATSSRLRTPGFQTLYVAGRDEDDPEEKEGSLPELEKGEDLTLHGVTPDQHFTQPPPRFTDATLVKELEARGIGRPSTYAPILSTLQDRGYVERSGRHLQPLELGVIVSDLLALHFANVVDEKFTAAMEEELDEIAAGRREWVPVLKDFYVPLAEALAEAQQNMERVKVEPEPAGEDCPNCTKPLVIRVGRFGRFIACSGFPECRTTKPLLTHLGAA
ncbi:MAG: type I DNA topoisomerase, partial [Chloroflexi bacterium]|nr:type I DNA topoisomerase [Chloroflexota bacterium]